VFPTGDPDIEMVIGEYHEDGGDGPFGALGRNFKFSIATRNTVNGETTTWIDDEKGSVYGPFYSSSAGYLVFEWDSRRDGSSDWQIVFADGSRGEVDAALPDAGCADSWVDMVPWTGNTGDGYPMIAFVRSEFCEAETPDPFERVFVNILGGPRLATPIVATQELPLIGVDDVRWTADGLLEVTGHALAADGSILQSESVVVGPAGGEVTTTAAPAPAPTTTAGPDPVSEAAAFFMVGEAEAEAGNAEAAIGVYRTASEIDPENREYADRLGVALLGTAPSSAVPTVTWPVEVWPEALAVTPDAVWVSNAGSRSVSQLDRANLNPLGASSVGRLPGDLEVAPDGSVWVLARTDRTIWRIDPDTGDATSEVELPDCPESMTTVPSGALAVVLSEDCSSVNSSVVVVDPRTGELTESAHLGLEAAGEILFAKDKLFVVAGVGLDMPRRGLRAYFHRLDDTIPEATEIVGPVLDLLFGEAVRSIVTDGQHVFVDVFNGDGTDIYRFALNGETMVRLATLDAPAVTMTATDRFLIAVGDDGSVSFVVSEVAGFAVTLDMGIGPLQLLGEATLADERLLFTHFSEDGAGVIVAVDLN
jgi:streptogramin lyase